ncbi:hypothetical protein [Clostridium sp. JS66]|uniref:hypothetical protein n=1 Tax=Clostridium sp. JS66 TaxID=3064705 RepID=UPI00298E334B|nr:hypothetical protein [Clostridium sp. JS66]WPC42929.1 hypothetical protein Q6H37_05510 [Clostridium sp. JS66]
MIGCFHVKKLYLADSLSYLGFRYMKFTDKFTGDMVYSFKDTDQFRMALNDLLNLKEKYRNN